MSRTLKLVDRLLAVGRNYQELGRHHDAYQILKRLAGFGELPGAVAEETQVRLAEIWLHRRKYRRARRHLTAALVHRPDCARYHYLMAGALAADERIDRQRAAEHYRKSLDLDPKQPQWLCEFGLFALQIGQVEAGLHCLRRAVELAPHDPEAVDKLVRGLEEAGCPDEARNVLRATLFRNPRDGRFRRLWNDFQFQQLCETQQRSPHDVLEEGEAASGPVLLPFVRPAPDGAPIRGRLVRRDPGASPQPPHSTRPGRVPRRYAQ
jgi:tetratricopeptide (TPR) repeat protein